MVAAVHTPVESPSRPDHSDDAPTIVHHASGPTSVPPSAGELIGGEYKLESTIGEGGVGSVYRAVQLKVQRPVAIKFLQREMLGEMDMRPRFEREAMALSAMRHPNIVRFQDYGIADGRPYLVMDLIEGRTLLQIIGGDGAMTTTRAIAICRQLLYALAYAHDRGLVHRDLKSANVMVQSLPHQPEHVTILDFGFVKLLPGHRVDGAAPLTRSGVAFGSPPYISPEQATGSEVDARADLYSVGVLLFEMLTGTRPFDGEITDVLRQHLSAPVPKLASRNANLASRNDLQALIEKAMAKSRAQRFASADAMLAALDTVDDKSADVSITRVGHDIAALSHAGWQRFVPWARAFVVRGHRELGPLALRGLRLIASSAKQGANMISGWIARWKSSR